MKMSQPKAPLNWVVIEITSRGEEDAKMGVLSRVLERVGNFDPADIYIPIMNVGSKNPTFLMEGYVFIKSGYPASNYFRLKNLPQIEQILTEFDDRSAMIGRGVISDEDLKDMIRKATKMGGTYKVGDKVQIKSGELSGFEAEILDIIKPGAEDEVNWLESLGITLTRDQIRSIKVKYINKQIMDGLPPVKKVSRTPPLEVGVVYYSIYIKLRSAEIITLIDNFSLEG
jgi:transcription antitermination factor NusG